MNRPKTFIVAHYRHIMIVVNVPNRSFYCTADKISSCGVHIRLACVVYKTVTILLEVENNVCKRDMEWEGTGGSYKIAMSHDIA